MLGKGQAFPSLPPAPGRGVRDLPWNLIARAELGEGLGLVPGTLVAQGRRGLQQENVVPLPSRPHAPAGVLPLG